MNQRLESQGITPRTETASFEPASNHLRTLLHCFWLAAGLSGLAFLFFAFAPVPFLNNFATTIQWQTAPLRITSLQFDRFHEGFAVEGEVWNQTDLIMPGIQASFSVLDQAQEVLDTVTVPVQPSDLQPGSSGTFQIRYTENSPFLYGYRVRFIRSDGSVVAHVEGFDVR